MSRTESTTSFFSAHLKGDADLKNLGQDQESEDDRSESDQTAGDSDFFDDAEKRPQDKSRGPALIDRRGIFFVPLPLHLRTGVFSHFVLLSYKLKLMSS